MLTVWKWKDIWHKSGVFANQLPNENQYSSRFSSERYRSGHSLDLSNGTAEALTGGTEDVFDGGQLLYFHVRKDCRAEQENPCLPKRFQPSGLWKPKALLDASDPKYFSIDDEGTAPVTRNFIKWYDLSGNGHHAVIEAGTPYWNSTLLGSMPEQI